MNRNILTYLYILMKITATSYLLQNEAGVIDVVTVTAAVPGAYNEHTPRH